MSIQSEVAVNQGNFNYNLKFELKDSSGVAKDLTSATSVLFICQKVGATAVKFSGDMVIDDDPTTGIVTYTVQATDFDEAGKYYAEIEIIYTGGEGQETFNNIIISAVEKLPK